MWIKQALLTICGLSFGLLAAAGVFTVLVAVGLIPRFAGKTHTAKKIVLYENMVVLGTILGGIFSLFREDLRFYKILFEVGVPGKLLLVTGNIFMVAFGLFAGIFIGCLALAIAEMLDSIPIFTRRISFRHGLKKTIFCMALGKLCGSLVYFCGRIYDWI